MKKSFKFLLALTPMLLVAACGGGDDSLDDRLDIADAKIRLVHAVPLAPNVSLFRNNVARNAEQTNLAYKDASNYLYTESGTATWDVRTATGGANVGTATFDASRGNKYTLVAVPDATTGTELLFISDPYDKELTATNARVRVLNASFNATSVDVYLLPANTAITAVSPDFPAVNYKSANPASGSNSKDITAGGRAYTLAITAKDSKVPVFSAAVTVPNNDDWLLTLVPDSVARNDVKVLLVKSDASAPAVEVVNTL
ncbi:MAG: hypothetical protein RLZZ618_3198 [Pseudomonadota bacterium]|jgi:hypothetical protein